ncbi:MAG: extracellular solute-binding protein [Methylobacteriaceae bacterium]|jgi:peptide/nickel transport system substrate-binding protein|nr:extracellular solute-binding protein [Methylobacteriaceae bacterium]
MSQPIATNQTPTCPGLWSTAAGRIILGALVLTLLGGGCAEAGECPAAVDFGTEPVKARTALAMHGEPSLPEGFAHYPYVNPRAPKRGALVLALQNIFDSINPYIILGSAPDAAPRFVLQSLMSRSLDEPFTLYALLAQSYEMPDDRSSITFNLDPRAVFSDGVAVSADDVKFSFEMLASKGKPFHRSTFRLVKQVTVLSPTRIRFEFSSLAPCACDDACRFDRELPLIVATMPVFAKHTLDPETFGMASLKPLIGSGPYQFHEIDPGNRIVLYRNQRYWAGNLPVNRGLHNFDRIEYRFYREANALFEAFKSLRYNWRLENDPSRWTLGYDIKPVQDGTIRREAFPIAIPQGMTGLVFNIRNPLFQDKRVRKALSSMFDFRWINRNLYYRTQRRCTSYFAGSSLSAFQIAADGRERELLAPFLDEVEEDVLEGRWQPLEPDDTRYTDRPLVRAALDMLTDAGWTPGVDGILRRNSTGERLAFEIMVATREQERLAVNYAASLLAIGVSAVVRRVDDVQFWRRASRFEFDMMQRTWLGTPSPGSEQRNRWSSAAADSPGSLNYAGVRSPGVDAMIDALLAARSKEEFVSAVRALDRLLLSGYYVVPLFYTPDQWIAYDAHLAHPLTTPLMGAPAEIWWWRD